MPDLADGESTEMQGSGRQPYVLRNVGGVYSCSCPAWRNQSVPIERRTCKHLKKLRGEAAELERCGAAAGTAAAAAAARKASSGDSEDGGDEAGSAGPPLLLAHPWENEGDLAGWWMSEKLDGVRAWWDGARFLSRQGNEFRAPDWFVAGLPSVPLDGELWIDRKAFQRTVSIVRRHDRSDHWREIRYVVFDAPQVDAAFERRIDFVRETLGRVAAPHLVAHDHVACRDTDHLRSELARVESLGGEGLMLRRPESRYEAGRSTTLLKVKSFRDAEAVVVEHVAGKGRHKGRLGALVVRLPDGTEFNVGTGFSDRERAEPPAVGAKITFRYQELSTGGVPRFPSFVRAASVEGAARSTPSPTEPGAAPAAKSSRSSSAAAKSKSAGTATAAGSLPGAPSGSGTGSGPGSQSASQSKSGAGAGSVRRFEFVEGSSAKFWEIAVSGPDVAVRYGRLGSAGQTNAKTFADAAAAARHAEKLIEEKTGKGYVEMPAGE